MSTKSYIHNCNAGDLICALPGIREVYRKSGKKGVIYQVLDVKGHYMPGLIHSVKDDKGNQVCMNRKMFDMMRPLLLAQEYIEDLRVFEGQQVDIDLTIIREWLDYDPEKPGTPPKVKPGKQFVNIPNMALPGWLMLAYPPMACDFTEPWIDTPGLTIGYQSYIMVNRTERYLNKSINYSFLKKYDDDLIFTGTEREHQLFCKQFDLDIPRVDVDDFMELAEIMKLCRFFIGNQSFPWNLANAMGIPRILEMYALAPNCQPFVGKDNYGFLHQIPFEYYFEMLYNKEAAPLEQPDDAY